MEMEAEQAAAKAATDKAPDQPAKAAAAKAALTAALGDLVRLQAGKPATMSAADQALAADRKAAADETRRVGEIRRLCAGKHADIEAKAIEEGWSKDRAELEVLRASRTPANIQSGTGHSAPVTGEILSAALLHAARHPNVEKLVKPEILEAADLRFHGRIGLNEAIIEAARANGYEGRALKVDRDVLRAAYGELHAGGFSTVDISGILSNTANKYLLDGFTSVEAAWRTIAAIRAVNDLKQITSYRLTGGTQYEKVGAGGETHQEFGTADDAD
jgi:hypothetical protein